MSIITSAGNDFVKFARSLKTKKARAERGAFLVEGGKCVEELAAHMPELITGIIVSGDKYKSTADRLQKGGVRVISVSENVMNSVCECKTPQGIAAVASMPPQKEVFSGFIVMLDDVQDPQNIGTIIRTADAAGCSCVVASKQSADCFSPKAVRASMGSIFHIPIVRAELGDYINVLLSKGYEAACAHLKGETDFRLDWSRTCLIIGNESRGVSAQIEKMCTRLIKIPMYGKAESLNAAVAAGILIYKIRA